MLAHTQRLDVLYNFLFACPVNSKNKQITIINDPISGR